MVTQSARRHVLGRSPEQLRAIFANINRHGQLKSRAKATGKVALAGGVIGGIIQAVSNEFGFQKGPPKVIKDPFGRTIGVMPGGTIFRRNVGTRLGKAVLIAKSGLKSAALVGVPVGAALAIGGGVRVGAGLIGDVNPKARALGNKIRAFRDKYRSAFTMAKLGTVFGGYGAYMVHMQKLMQADPAAHRLHAKIVNRLKPVTSRLAALPRRSKIGLGAIVLGFPLASQIRKSETIRSRLSPKGQKIHSRLAAYGRGYVGGMYAGSALGALAMVKHPSHSPGLLIGGMYGGVASGLGYARLRHGPFPTIKQRESYQKDLKKARRGIY